MKLQKAIVFALIRILGLFFWLCPVRKNRIVFSSYFSKEPEGNLKCVLNRLRAQGAYDIRTVFQKYDNSPKGKLHYLGGLLRELYYFNSSRLIVLEGNSIVLAAMLKKKKVYALQLWHASGAFKKFGQDTPRVYRIRGLDGAVVSSRNVAGVYAAALNVPQENVYALGIPRLDPLFDETTAAALKEGLLTRHPDLKGKKILLYAPTFRGRGIDDVSGLHADLQAIRSGVSPDYAVCVRLHPLMRGKMLYKGFPDLSGEDLLAALCAADMLVTDYSSIIFEYAALNRPMLFLVPDLDEYEKTHGFYTDYRAFVPGKICQSEAEVIQAVLTGDTGHEKVPDFASRYLEYRDGRSTQRVCALISRIMQKMPPDVDGTI